MQGIILKCKYKISPEAHKELINILHEQWLDKGLMLLPRGIELAAVISDDKDTNIVLNTNEGDDYK